jgi:hypothetical protein
MRSATLKKVAMVGDHHSVAFTMARDGMALRARPLFGAAPCHRLDPAVANLNGDAREHVAGLDLFDGPLQVPRALSVIDSAHWRSHPTSGSAR